MGVDAPEPRNGSRADYRGTQCLDLIPKTALTLSLELLVTSLAWGVCDGLARRGRAASVASPSGVCAGKAWAATTTNKLPRPNAGAQHLRSVAEAQQRKPTSGQSPRALARSGFGGNGAQRSGPGAWPLAGARPSSPLPKFHFTYTRAHLCFDTF